MGWGVANSQDETHFVNSFKQVQRRFGGKMPGAVSGRFVSSHSTSRKPYPISFHPSQVQRRFGGKMPGAVSGRFVSFCYAFASLAIVNQFKAGIIATTISHDEGVSFTGLNDPRVGSLNSGATRVQWRRRQVFQNSILLPPSATFEGALRGFGGAECFWGAIS